MNMAQFERICTRNKLRTSVKQIIPSQVSTRMATNTTVILAIFMTDLCNSRASTRKIEHFGPSYNDFSLISRSRDRKFI